MQWQRLIRPQAEDWFPDQLKAEAEQLGRKVDGLIAERGQLDQAIGRCQAEDVTKFDPTNTVSFRAFADTQIHLLQKEVKLRRELAEYLERFHEALSAQVPKAWERHQKAEAEIRRKLVRLGYSDVPVTSNDPCKITPEFIMRHPTVRQARIEAEAIRSQSLSRDWAIQNETALTAIVKELERLRAEGLAGVRT